MKRRKPKRLKKRAGQKLHARRRVEQRYGRTLNASAMRNLIEQIQQGRSTFVERQSRRVTKHIVQHEGRSFFVVYDKHTGVICTFLPMEASNGYGAT